nr:uncharacterized protein LOC119173328 isoform X2 [Rhipicephalus microplus]
MARVFLFALISLSLNMIVLTKLGLPGGPQKLSHDTADTVKVFQSFPYVVSVTDSNNDTIFECMEANRTEFDPVAKTATFVWIFQAPDSPDRVEVPLPQKAGQEPGTVEFLDPFECALWVRRDVVKSLSKECIGPV